MFKIIKILAVIVMFSSLDVASAQIDFVKLKWEDALQLSKAESKPIFVDVYTQWCGPCKKMDATTFQDTAVGSYMNTHFINMKWDADSYKYSALAKQYGVKGYPTLLYIDHTGNVMKRRTGLQNKDGLLDLSDSVLKFAYADYSELLYVLKNNGQPIKKKLVDAMNDFNGFQFAQKEEMYNLLFDIYQKQDSVAISEYGIVVDNLYNIEHLKFAVRHYPSHTKLSSEERRSILKGRSKIKSKIDLLFADALKYKDRELMEETADVNIVFDTKVNSKNRVQNAAYENRNKLLEFYSRHRYKEAYHPLAAEMIKKEIIPYNPAMCRQRDEMRQGMKEKVLNGASNVPAHPRSKLIDTQKFSFKMAYKLQIVVDNYAEFYDDTALLEQALEWSELSAAYVDLPENRLSRAKVLSKLGYKDEAQMHIKKALSSVYINNKIKKQVLKFKDTLNTK